jgi:transposase
MRARLLPLSRAAQRRILCLDRKTRDADVRIRCRIVLKVSHGHSCRAAALQLGCVPSTGWRIVQRFRCLGEAGLLDGRCDNGMPKLDDDLRQAIEAILYHSPPDYSFERQSWTLELLARVIAQVLHVQLSVGHVWKILKTMGVRWGLPRPIVNCPWKAARRQRRLRKLRRLARHPAAREVVVYVDEVDIHLNPRIGRDWMPRGYQRRVLTPGQNAKHYVAGAYDPLRQRMVCVSGDRKVSWLFLNLLRALGQAYPWACRIHVILDNYVIHKSQLVLTALRAMPKIQLHFLPPYCPDHNKIERIWRDLHASVTRNHRCPDLEALMANVYRYLTTHFQVFYGSCFTPVKT